MKEFTESQGNIFDTPTHYYLLAIYQYLSVLSSSYSVSTWLYPCVFDFSSELYAYVVQFRIHMSILYL